MAWSSCHPVRSSAGRGLSVKTVFERLHAALESAKVPYMVTGSFASSAHGVPRATNDIDIVIAPTHEQLLALLEQFPESGYYSSREHALDALRHRSHFNVIDYGGMWKVDFIVRKDRAFSELELNRRTMVEIAGVTLYAATPEDVLLSKLEWAKGAESERQIDDAAGIIRVQGNNLDVGYIQQWVADLGLEHQWRAACARAV
jgi:hypothetical protein